MDDKDLLEKLLNPETRHYGFNLLVRAYQQRVYWHVRKMVIDHDDADDITQEIFIKIYNISRALDKMHSSIPGSIGLPQMNA